MPVLIIILVVLAVLVIPNIRTVHQGYVVIVERLGKYHTTWSAGLHVKVPLIDTMSKPISLKEQTYDFPATEMITADNVVVVVDSVVYSVVRDAQSYKYNIENPVFAIEQLTATTLRGIVGSMQFQDLLSSREQINRQMTEAIDAATDPWGIKVNRVEVKTLEASPEVQKTMQREMEAERNKRATILDAEAHQKSVITAAEGDKQAKILAAQAEAQSVAIRAEAEADAIRKMADAKMYEARQVGSVIGSNGLIALKGYEAMRDIADGNATKIYVPSDMASAMGKAVTLGEGIAAAKIEPMPKPVAQAPVDRCSTTNMAHKADAAQVAGNMSGAKAQPKGRLVHDANGVHVEH